MKKKALSTVLVSSHLVAVVAGFMGAAWYFDWWARDALGQANAMLNDGMLIVRYSTYADLQRVVGGTDEYREALLTLSEAIEQARSPNDPLLTDNVYFTDKALTYTNLARLEEGAGNSYKAGIYRKNAIEACSSIPWDNCSYEYLEKISRKLEENSVLNSLQKKTNNN